MIDWEVLKLILRFGANVGAPFLPPVISGGIATAVSSVAELQRLIDAHAAAKGKTREELLAEWDIDFQSVKQEIDENNAVYEGALKLKG